MKSILKTNLLIVGLFAGISTAFATSIHKQTGLMTYNCTGQAGTFSGSIDAAMDFYGCSGEGQICATCTNVNNPNDVVTLRHDQ